MRRFLAYIALTWTIPPVFGLAFLVFIRLFTFGQILALLTTPIEPFFIVGSLAFALWYFGRFIQPVSDYLRSPATADAHTALARLNRFALDYWIIFLVYLLLAPSSVMLSAMLYTGFEASAADWFRVHLVALIVSIIVGLPIFFRILDLFGRALGDLPLTRAHLTVRTKVFLIAALMPLLIDTMLVQYYWTRTGYFTAETFLVWLALEALAVAGAVIFVRSFSQSLAPLQQLSGAATDPAAGEPGPRSTDELGVFAREFRSLIDQLRESETNLRSIAENANDGILVHVDGRLVFANRRLAALLGYDMRELLALGIAGLLRADEAPRIVERYRHRLKGEAVPDQYETVAVTRDGRELPVEITAALTRWHGGPAIIVVIRDISQRRLAEAALRESEERFRKVFRSTAAIISISTLDEGVFLDVNESFLRTSGFAREEVIGHTAHELAIWPLPSQRDDVVRHVARSGSASNLELTYRVRSGELRYMLGSVERISIGDEPCLLAVFQDITDRKLAQEDLAREKERAQVTLASISDGVITTDVDGIVDYLNPIAEQLTGWNRAEALGRPLAEVFRIIGEHTRHPPGDPVKRCLREGRLAGLAENTILIRRDGRECAIEDSAAPIRSFRGEVAGVVLAFRDVTQTRAMARQITYQASHDSLTGLINRREFEVRLERLLDEARAKGATHALCYLDLDQFKVINDTCGHIAGDEMLRQLASQLQASIPPGDTLARLGGDEFGVLLRDCALDRAREVADGLRRVVRAFRFLWAGNVYEVGVSIGLVPIGPDSGSPSEVLSAVDSACYVAKDQGRNRIHVYQPNDKILAQWHGEMQWVTRINRALETDQLELHFQPIQSLSAQGGEERLCEFLLRMRDERGMLVPPLAFLPAGERYNLMSAIDRWVVRRALATLRSPESAFHRHGYRCAMINLSGQSLGDPHVLDFIVAELDRTGLDPRQVCFEITETAAIANLTHAARFMATLRGMGCRFALDDFGSGLSSFIYLKNLPVDYLKIAGDFVQHMVDDPIDEAMVESINQVGHVIGVRTIAESVESEAALERLRRIGVDYAQGYHVGRPMPLEAPQPDELGGRAQRDVH